MGPSGSLPTHFYGERLLQLVWSLCVCAYMHRFLFLDRPIFSPWEEQGT